jgi:alkaline phosphatase D
MLGVASGFPTASSVVLWTRLAPEPLNADGGVMPVPVPVQWQVAEDASMRSVISEGLELALPEDAHAVHAEPANLRPGREYWYRFVAGGVASPIGHTRTAPAAGESGRLKLAVCSCQMYEHGYFNAYRALLEDDLDLIVHVGDYIYEGSWGENPVRSHGAPEAQTLEDYRLRYALYKMDPDLRAAHEACPWIATWDDHEVSNDYAGDISQRDDPPEQFRRRRAAAYRAYYEHLPLPRAVQPGGPDAWTYT